jgi:hypothetical protein
MNRTRATVPVVATVPIAVLLVAAVAFPRLGPAHAESLPRPEPGVLAPAAVAVPAASAGSASVAVPAAAAEPRGGVRRDTHGYAYLGKQQAILEHLDRAPRFRSAPTGSTLPAVVGGVPRDRHGGAYLGKQPAILEHLGP